MDKDQLAALDRDVREAENYVYRMQCEAFLGRALINLYRANQIAVIGPEAVEKVARAIVNAGPHPDRQAEAALAALGVK